MSTASRTPDQITAEISDTRDRLAATIDQLVYRTKPKTIVGRQIDAITAKFVNADGSPNVQMIAKVAGGVVGVLVLLKAIRTVLG